MNVKDLVTRESFDNLDLDAAAARAAEIAGSN